MKVAKQADLILVLSLFFLSSCQPDEAVDFRNTDKLSLQREGDDFTQSGEPFCLADIKRLEFDYANLRPLQGFGVNLLPLAGGNYELVELALERELDELDCAATYVRAQCELEGGVETCMEGVTTTESFMIRTLPYATLVDFEMRCCAPKKQVVGIASGAFEYEYLGENYVCGPSSSEVTGKSLVTAIPKPSSDKERLLSHRACSRHWDKRLSNRDQIVAKAFKLCRLMGEHPSLLHRNKEMADLMLDQGCLAMGEVLYQHFSFGSEESAPNPPPSDSSLQLAGKDSQRSGCFVPQAPSPPAEEGLQLAESATESAESAMQAVPTSQESWDCSAQYRNLKALSELESHSSLKTFQVGLLAMGIATAALAAKWLTNKAFKRRARTGGIPKVEYESPRTSNLVQIFYRLGKKTLVFLGRMGIAPLMLVKSVLYDIWTVKRRASRRAEKFELKQIAKRQKLLAAVNSLDLNEIKKATVKSGEYGTIEESQRKIDNEYKRKTEINKKLSTEELSKKVEATKSKKTKRKEGFRRDMGHVGKRIVNTSFFGNAARTGALAAGVGVLFSEYLLADDTKPVEKTIQGEYDSLESELFSLLHLRDQLIQEGGFVCGD